MCMNDVVRSAKTEAANTGCYLLPWKNCTPFPWNFCIPFPWKICTPLRWNFCAPFPWNPKSGVTNFNPFVILSVEFLYSFTMELLYSFAWNNQIYFPPV